MKSALLNLVALSIAGVVVLAASLETSSEMAVGSDEGTSGGISIELQASNSGDRSLSEKLESLSRRANSWSQRIHGHMYQEDSTQLDKGQDHSVDLLLDAKDGCV